MTLAEWIEAEGITRTAAADRLGLSQSYLTELCQQKRSPSIHVAIRIVETSKGAVTFRELVDGSVIPRGTAAD